MKWLVPLIIYCLLLVPVRSLAADDGYGYPIEDAYEATIIGTPFRLMPKPPKDMKRKSLTFEVFPERKKPQLFFYDKGVRCNFAYQKKKAPLVFLIAGTGTSGLSPKLDTMTGAFYQAGFHVITIPSPTNSNFIISASESRVPGDLTEDARDLYRTMERAWNEVKDDIEVSDFNLCGYSIGGTEAAFVAKLDEERKLFNFRKVLMINPPVSVYDSIVRIEDLLKQIPGGPKQEGAFFNKMMQKFVDFYRYGNFIGINDDFIYAVYQKRLFSKQETAGLIGLAYRINLAGMIFSSDVMTGGGYVVPKNRELKHSESLFEYFLVCSHLSYFNYLDEYFYPYFQKKRPGLTREALIASESLQSIDGYLGSSQKIGVMTNANDFILSPEDLAYLKRLFGERARIYPRGGHLGNLEYKENLADMVAFFGGQMKTEGGTP